MNKNVRKKIQEFVEQEKRSPQDEDLIEKLHTYLELDTLYWDIPPAKRNSLNTFFTELSDDFMSAMFVDKYGPHIVNQSLLVTSFEVGYRLGLNSGLDTVKK